MPTVSVDRFPEVGLTTGLETESPAMVEKQHPMSQPLRESLQFQSRWDEQDAGPCLDIHAIWRVSTGLDLADRTVLEGEVLVWRICSASLR